VLLLAVESATSRASVALSRGDEVIAHRAADGTQHHSETLLPMIDAVLAEAGVAQGAVEAFAVSIGPGAFTSLRVGLATVKGLCFGTGRPVVPVPTLEALAEAARAAGCTGGATTLVPVLDARRGEVYAAAYTVGEGAGGAKAGLVVRMEARVLAPGALAEALPEGGCLIGEGSGVVAAALDAGAAVRFDARSAAGVVPDAVSVGRIGRARLAAGEAEDAAALVPRYVRRAEAEVKRTAERFE